MQPISTAFGYLGVDQAIAVAVLREMAVGALQALFGMDVHHVYGLAGVDAGRNELAFARLAPFFGVVGGNDLAVGIEQIALTVAFENAAKFQPWP